MRALWVAGMCTLGLLGASEGRTGQWIYDTSVNEDTGLITNTALLQTADKSAFLGISDSPKIVFVRIVNQSLECAPVKECFILIQFDRNNLSNDKAFAISANSLLFANSDSMLDQILRSKRLTIEVNISGQGFKGLQFNLSDLDLMQLPGLPMLR